MAGLIPNDFIDSLNDRVDIVEVIGNRIDLKKKGKDYWACCPFHNENSPSFSVNVSKQFYYCFGCGVSGTSLKFIQEYENRGFVEAVEDLARMAGVEVPREADTPQLKKKRQRQRSLYELMESCSQYYQDQLYQHPNSRFVQDYIVNRGLSEETVKTFQIGYSPQGWDNLIKLHGSKETTNRELLSAGMLTQNENGKIYDRFRERLMFPIRDFKGRLIAFGGRVMAADQKPKYLNSPETPIFHKGSELYGLYEARNALKELDHILIVEGYMDVVVLHQHGVKNAVATLGTATSSTHIQKLFKQTSEIVFCFDGDNAGRRAAIKALTNTLPEIKDGFQARFLFLPDGEDPDSLIQSEGHSAFTRRVQQAQSIAEFLFNHLQSQVDTSKLEGRAKLANIAQDWINPLQETVFKQLLFNQLSELVGLSVEQIKNTYTPTKNTTELEQLAPEYEEHNDFDSNDLPPSHLPTYAPLPKKELSVRIGFTHRAVAWLIRFPRLADDIQPERLEKLSQSNDKDLLLNVVKLLKESPRKEVYFAFDYLCQHGLRNTLAPIASSDYLWLEADNTNGQDEFSFAKEELEKILIALTQKAPDDEYDALKKRVLSLDPTLTSEDKHRYRTLLKQKKSTTN